jgi:hypothetical protein
MSVAPSWQTVDAMTGEMPISLVLRGAGEDPVPWLYCFPHGPGVKRAEWWEEARRRLGMTEANSEALVSPQRLLVALGPDVTLLVADWRPVSAVIAEDPVQRDQLRDWAWHAIRHGSCRVVFIPTDAPVARLDRAEVEAEYDQSTRISAGGTCVVAWQEGWAPPPQPGTVGPFSLVATGGLASRRPDALWLDTHVAIEVAKTFYRMRQSEADRDAVKDLLLLYVTSQLHFGPAVAESYLSQAKLPPGALDRARRLRFALREVAGWDGDRISWEFAQETPPAERIPPREVESLDDDWMVGLDETFIRASYVSLLKHHQLWVQRGGSAHPAETLEQWCGWMRSNVGYVPAYERQIVIDDLFGMNDDRRYVSGLLKLGGREGPAAVKKKLRNAAWDLFHLRMVDGHSTLPLFPGGPTYAALVTRDSGILSLRSRTLVVGTAEQDGIELPVMFSALPHPRQPFVSEEDLMAVACRMQSPSGGCRQSPDPEMLRRAQAEVEQEMDPTAGA